MSARLRSRLAKIESKLGHEEVVRLWLRNLRRFNSEQEYLAALLEGAVSEEPGAGSPGRHRSRTKGDLDREESSLVFAKNLVLELNHEILRMVDRCNQLLDKATAIVDLVAAFSGDEAHQGRHTAMSRGTACPGQSQTAVPTDRSSGPEARAVTIHLTNARAAITNAMIDLETSAQTAESISKRFRDGVLLFGSVAAALTNARERAALAADTYDRAVTRIRKERGRSWWCEADGPATIDRKMVESSASESSAVMANKLKDFSEASMLVALGRAEEAKKLMHRYLERGAGKDRNA